MKFINILPIAALTLLISSCSDNKEVEPAPAAGKDVVFSASAPQSRTEYQSPNADGSYPIWWLPNDQMLVMSPQCAIKYGQYQVGTTVPATGAASAGTLQKIGATGVQWGEDATADFYSVYPYSKVEQNGIKPDSKTVTMRMPHIQNDYIHNNGNGTYTAKADMDASFLYAQANGVKNGENVNLGYKSLSTAIRFTLVGPNATNAQSTQIQYIRITSANDTRIAGQMDVTFGDNATVIPSVKYNQDDSYNYVYIYSSYEGAEGGGYLTLEKGQKIELNAFVIPEQDCNIENWTIEVQTLTKKYTKALGKGNLARGMIHNLGELPALDADNESEWNVENWMVNIPRNTYISEISLPGSWNSMNSDFQSNTDLTAQYNIGIRAFHLDCRYNGTRSSVGDLAIANGGSTYDTHTGAATNGKVMRSAPTFESCLTTITSNIKDDEYMVVLCTFAQGSATKSGETWEQSVSNACAQNQDVILGSNLSDKSVVNDVLGKVIVIVYSEGAIPNIEGSKCLFVNAPLTLTSEMFTTSGQYNTDDLHWGNQTASGLKLAVSQAQIESNNNSPITRGDRGYGPTHAQRLAQLNAILDWSKSNYGSSSRQNATLPYLGIGGYSAYYDSGTLGIGAGVKPSAPSGSDYSDAYQYIAGTYNTWIYNRIQDMIDQKTNFYPIGIVLMNMVNGNTNYNGTSGINGQSTVKQILLLNNRYQKAYDKDKPAWPNGTQSLNENQFGSVATNAGDAWVRQ